LRRYACPVLYQVPYPAAGQVPDVGTGHTHPHEVFKIISGVEAQICNKSTEKQIDELFSTVNMLYTRYTQTNFVVAGEKLTTENLSLYWVTDPRPMLHSHFCKVRKGLPKMLEDLDYNGL
jgi:hypothetical protein